LKWSEEELQILRQKYPEQGSDIEELTENRTKGSIRSKAKRLDISTQKTALDPKTKDKDNFKTGFLVGSLIGDGNIKKNESRISFTQKDEDYIDELITTFNKLTDKKPSKYDSREKYYEISFNSKKWIPVFKDLKSKVLKENSEFSKEFKKGYVTGLFDSELDKGEKCDRCGKTSYEEANEEDVDHRHDWRPDGDSFTKTRHENGCPWEHGNDYHAMDKIQCVKNCEHYRVRRYTCHCGESKTVDI